MMTFNVNVNVTGLEGLTSVLAKLASVVPVNPVATMATVQEPVRTQIVATPSVQPQMQATYTQVPQIQLAPVVPIATIAPQSTSPQPIPIQQQSVAAVPIAAQGYSMEQIAVAATQLMDAGRRGELVSLLATFGVQALTALPKEQYGTFATQLRAMGVKI